MKELWSRGKWDAHKKLDSVYISIFQDTKIEDIRRFVRIEVANLGVARSHLK